MDLSASCLCYLFADRRVGLFTLGQRLRRQDAVTVPTSGALVHLGLLQQQLLAVALSSLEASNHISISWTDRPRVLLPFERDRGEDRPYRDQWGSTPFALRLHPVRLNPAEAQDLGTLDHPAGLEAKLLAGLVGSSHVGLGLNQLVDSGCLYEGARLAVNGVIAVAQREAIAHGVLRGAERTGTLPRSLRWSEPLPDYVTDQDLIEALEVSFSGFERRQGQWVQSHPHLWHRLLSECPAALTLALGGRLDGRLPSPPGP